MVEYEEAFADYLAAYRALRLKLLDEKGPVTGDYLETVRTTWKRSFDTVAQAAPAASALLRLSAFFAPDAIPYELILEGASELGEPLASALASPAPSRGDGLSLRYDSWSISKGLMSESGAQL